MQNLKQNDINHYLHPYTNLSLHREVGPMVIERGEGVYVYDSEGNRYLEGLGGLFCASLGFSETRLADAADRQMRKLPFYHAFGHKSSEPSILLAEKLISMAPVPMSKVFFANSGSEANDTAVKLIWYFNNAIGRPQKKKIISRTRAYHGVTIASASLTGLQNNHRDFDLPIDRILHTDCPHFYRYGLPGESEEQFATRCAESLERLILEEGADTIAAFFAEPVMASGGVIVPPATYMEKVQAVLKRHDILLVADEVICGFGRTGNMFGSQTFGMQPDMITMAKQLSAGYLPISALMVNERIYRGLVTESEKIGTFGHGFTYSGHPVCAAVALETLKIYEQDGILEHVRAVTPHFQERVAELGRHPLVGEARGVGLLAAVELVADKASREPFAPSEGVAAYAGTRALSHGLITRALGDTVNFCPPLIVTRAQIDEMFDAAKRALDDTLAWRKTLNNN
ncbi:aspartate aminotransferase family protein [Paraburkholderia hospita]|jgi:4-aminobutyrate--pyruvate transaminase|uniref:Aminotransferase n=1 Tax=Paraburkholderia hospita TaxID=169430 RepID=A0AAN1JCZ6_9BURK|nr:aspartate aminotransferase family protein [Paraburkholderia hospita]AUT71430.1 aspartate aminotransferase family protein [Paraburkholderia hospita]EIM94330.1 aminotransferase [Paraburkholderia hospita]OUL68480.1 aspartate aminotransferase family protein [Paraburkholderia hospita]OUL74313.1 aspartate aminotransferase family protein [Paraburkholderia hospita]SEI02977.1 4-aminobutyrate---pyruvate transaminase [Paraburkholderia hospita]